MANHALPVSPGRPHRIGGDQRRRKPPPVEQVHSGASDDTAATGLLERAALSARISARIFRDEFSAAAPARGEPRPSGCVLHARLQPGQPVTQDEYYGWMFEHSVPGLPEAAAREGLTPLAYMRKYGAFKIKDNVYELHAKPLAPDALAGTTIDADDVVLKDGRAIGVVVDGIPRAGFNTPSRRLEF